MAEPGSAGNVIAAIASFFIPGLGQLVQGRLFAALTFLIIAVVAWALGMITLGVLSFLAIVVNIWACIDAAVYKRRP